MSRAENDRIPGLNDERGHELASGSLTPFGLTGVVWGYICVGSMRHAVTFLDIKSVSAQVLGSGDDCGDGRTGELAGDGFSVLRRASRWHFLFSGLSLRGDLKRRGALMGVSGVCL